MSEYLGSLAGRLKDDGFAGRLLVVTSQGGVIDVGDTASFSFKGPLVNGMGLKSLGELRGKPVLVDFWGTR